MQEAALGDRRPLRAKGALDDPPDEAAVLTAVLIQHRRLPSCDPPMLHVLRLFEPRPLEVAVDLHEEVELAVWLRPVDARSRPILDMHEDRRTANGPAGLLRHLAA